MARTTFMSVSQYIASQPKAAQAALRTVRATIRKAMPRAKEAISYNIPAYKLDGRTVLYFAAWKEHYSLYPSTAQLEKAFEQELAAYELSHKGTIRFPLSEAVPVKLIAGIAKFRAREAAGHERPQAAAKRR
jgi:uncharacterized protein YdhG (YjbR/CyaY superfamily)